MCPSMYTTMHFVLMVHQLTDAAAHLDLTLFAQWPVRHHAQPHHLCPGVLLTCCVASP